MIESGRHRRRRRCSVWLTRCFAWPVGARTVGKDATALEAYLVWLGRAAAPEGGRRRRQHTAVQPLALQRCDLALRVKEIPFE